MAHVLARIKGIRFEELREYLLQEAASHAAQGLYLEHLWRNADDVGESMYLYRTTDLKLARRTIFAIHNEMIAENPGAALPLVTFLQDNDSVVLEREGGPSILEP